MNWIELDIFTSTECIEALSGRLLMLGINGFVVKDSNDFEEFLSEKTGNWDYVDDSLMGLRDVETTITVYLPENSQGYEMLGAIKQELLALKEIDSENKFGRLEYELKNVKEEDWANNWKQYFKPLKIGEKILVKPSWIEMKDTEGRKILEIDPASSFGTGQHNTTKLCLELIEKYVKDGDRLLDLGCGSGILSIGAMLLGAGYSCAVDIDENSVRIAGENAEINNILKENYVTYCGNVINDETLREKIGKDYDLVCANIVADVLIAMSGIFGNFLKKDCVLVVSGIIVEREDEVLGRLKELGYELLEKRESEGWAAGALIKRF